MSAKDGRIPHSFFENFPERGLCSPEEERPGPFDLSLTVALDAGLEAEGVGGELVVGGDGAVLTAAAGVLDNHGHGQRDAAQVL